MPSEPFVSAGVLSRPFGTDRPLVTHRDAAGAAISRLELSAYKRTAAGRRLKRRAAARVVRSGRHVTYTRAPLQAGDGREGRGGEGRVGTPRHDTTGRLAGTRWLMNLPS